MGDVCAVFGLVLGLLEQEFVDRMGGRRLLNMMVVFVGLEMDQERFQRLRRREVS